MALVTVVVTRLMIDIPMTRWITAVAMRTVQGCSVRISGDTAASAVSSPAIQPK